MAARIVVTFSGEAIRQKILRLLHAEGWETAAVCTSGAETIRVVRRMGSAAVICGFRLPDMTADSLAADLRGTAALLVVAKAGYLELCGGENLFQLAIPATRSEFFSALYLLLDYEATHLRHPPSQRREEEQQVIRQAKALLMDVNRMSEEAAHRLLQKRSMETGVKLVEAARQIIASYML